MTDSGDFSFNTTNARETVRQAAYTNARACSTPNAEAADPSNDNAQDKDRRQFVRLRSIGRPILLVAKNDSGLCRLHNLSNSGMMIETAVRLDTVDPVQLWLDHASNIEGRIVWSLAVFAGIEFLNPIDAFAVMSKTADDYWAGLSRPPRLPVESTGRATTSQGSFAIVVANISQKGTMIRHSANIVSGTEILVSLDSGLKAHGRVRWSSQALAGIEFSGKITIDQLARASEL